MRVGGICTKLGRRMRRRKGGRIASQRIDQSGDRGSKASSTERQRSQREDYGSCSKYQDFQPETNALLSVKNRYDGVYNVEECIAKRGKGLRPPMSYLVTKCWPLEAKVEDSKAGGKVRRHENQRSNGDRPPIEAAPYGGYRWGMRSSKGKTPAAASE